MEVPLWKTSIICYLIFCIIYLSKKLSIDFSGARFVQLGYQEYQCHQGKDNKIGKKQKYHSEKKAALTQDQCFLKNRRTTQATKKLDCPVTLLSKRHFVLRNLKLMKMKKQKK